MCRGRNCGWGKPGIETPQHRQEITGTASEADAGNMF